MTSRYNLSIPRHLHDAMMAHARNDLPNECCGLLAGVLGGETVIASAIFPLVNAASRPEIEYLSDPHSMFAAVKAMRRDSLDVVAIYHSHPTSAAIPSRKDIESNYGDSVVNLIISLPDGQAEMRAWWLWENNFEEGKWDIADN